MPNYNKEVNYVGRDFGNLRDNLIELAKSYFPTAYKDFNESSPGMLFLEAGAYVGDVMGYYTDVAFKESLLPYAEEKNQIFNIAQFMGYQPRLASPALVTLTFTSEVPALTGTPEDPDLDYAINVKGETRVKTNTGGIEFRLLDDCNFATSTGNRTIEVSETNSSGTPTYYRLTKTVNATSGFIKDEKFTFGTAEKYSKIVLMMDNVTDIVSIKDDANNTWYEVPFLAQDTVFKELHALPDADPSLTQYNETSPYMLRRTKTSKRFKTHTRPDNKMELRFGAGTQVTADEELIPNPTNIGSNLPGSPSKLGIAFDPANFLRTKAYGEAPANTTLTITYTYGGDANHNVGSRQINDFSSKVLSEFQGNLDATKLARVKNSLAVYNEEPASGGMSGESVGEIKENALAHFQAQGRAVTKEDIIARIYSLPERFGNVAKAYVVPDDQITTQPDGTDNEIMNQFGLNVYLLGFDESKRLTKLNDVVKNNLKIYMGRFRMLTDAYNLKNAYIINLSMRFDILSEKGYNKNEVLLRAMVKMFDYFDIDRWQINEPIVIASVVKELLNVEGVAAVQTPVDNNPLGTQIAFSNRYDVTKGYSGNLYDLSDPSVMKKGILYPAKDPSIFEVRYPKTDIVGKVVGDI